MDIISNRININENFKAQVITTKSFSLPFEEKYITSKFEMEKRILKSYKSTYGNWIDNFKRIKDKSISDGYFYTIEHNGEECVALYSIEKHRRKKVIKSTYKSGKNKGLPKEVAVIPTHYVGYCYYIPVSLIKNSGKKVVKTNKDGYKLV